jgi:hypothetical protein
MEGTAVSDSNGRCPSCGRPKPGTGFTRTVPRPPETPAVRKAQRRLDEAQRAEQAATAKWEQAALALATAQRTAATDTITVVDGANPGAYRVDWRDRSEVTRAEEAVNQTRETRDRRHDDVIEANQELNRAALQASRDWLANG